MAFRYAGLYYLAPGHSVGIAFSFGAYEDHGPQWAMADPRSFYSTRDQMLLLETGNFRKGVVVRNERRLCEYFVEVRNVGNLGSLFSLHGGGNV